MISGCCAMRPFAVWEQPHRSSLCSSLG